MIGVSPARILLMIALLANVAPMHARAEPFAAQVTTLDSVWTFSASVYASDAPDNPVPMADQLTYVYQLTALERMTLDSISVIWEGKKPVRALGSVDGSGDVSPYDFLQGQNFQYHGMVFQFSFEQLDALEKTDLLYAHSVDRPGPALVAIQQGATDEPTGLRTLGPSVAEPGIATAIALTLAGTGLTSASSRKTCHEVTRCS